MRMAFDSAPQQQFDKMQPNESLYGSVRGCARRFFEHGRQSSQRRRAHYCQWLAGHQAADTNLSSLGRLVLLRPGELMPRSQATCTCYGCQDGSRCIRAIIGEPETLIASDARSCAPWAASLSAAESCAPEAPHEVLVSAVRGCKPRAGQGTRLQQGEAPGAQRPPRL